VLIGEVGLLGEVRRVKGIDKRLKEAVNFGFKNIIVPKNNLNEIKGVKNNIIGVENVKEAVDYCFN